MDQEKTGPPPPVVAMVIPAADATAFERFFRRLPLSLGVSYLIMEYYGAPGGRLYGGAAETLPAMLERTTLLPVRMPTQDTVLEEDRIYLLPPDSVVGLVGGRLVFQGSVANGVNDYLPDLFLASVASGSGGRCAVYLLSDIAARVLPGLKVVRDEGGFTVVLDEEDPFLSPHPVHQCPLVDLFLTAPEAASGLTRLAKYFRDGGRENGERLSTPADWNSLYQLLLDRKGVDYSRYPREAIARRIHRRMAIGDMGSPDEYAIFASVEEEELTRLNDELQSTVGGYYLNPDLEVALTESVLPRWLGAGPHSAPLRVWLPHCSGGHKAYSIAMTIMEWLEAKGSKSSLQLFVTCFNNNSIALARKGVYDKEEMAYVTRSRRRKFFIRKENHWQVVKAIRDKCIFAVHDLLKDSPFSQIDIIIESGSLVGFETDACAKAFRRFHYALAPGGFLIANTRCPHAVPAEFYTAVEGFRGLYGRKEVSSNFWLEGARSAPAPSMGEQQADKLLLSGYVPASFLVDEQFKVIRFYGNAEPYLRAGRDLSSRYLFRIIRDELVFELNDLIELTDKEGKALTRKGILLGDEGPEVSVEMVPLRSFGANRRLIIIREKGAQPEIAATQDAAGRGPSLKDLRIQAMEKEVQEMRGLLLAADQDAGKVQTGLQRANEDLQASNEEYLSLNKELRSLNEELTDLYEEMLTRQKELNELNEGLRAHIREIRSASDSAVAIVATLNRPIAVLREDLQIHTANRAFLQLFGVSSEQALGQYLYAVGPEVLSREAIRLRLQQVQSERLGMDFEIRHQLREGGEKVLHFNATRIAGVSGLRSGILLTIDDVTEQRDLQRFKDELIGIASHELRTPATSIRAYSELLAREMDRDKNAKSVLLMSKLNSQVDRLSLLTRDLMDVSRIARGKIDLEEEAFDINALISETAAATHAQVPISVAPLPPSPPFHGDRRKIARVLDSLLSNAINYSGKSEPVGIRTVVTDENVEVSIRISGTGMPVEQIRQIFDLGYPGDGVSSVSIPGLSLGLYISTVIVRKHGGTIRVTSEKGNGSAFSVVLPFDKKRVAGLSAV